MKRRGRFKRPREAQRCLLLRFRRPGRNGRRRRLARRTCRGVCHSYQCFPCHRILAVSRRDANESCVAAVKQRVRPPRRAVLGACRTRKITMSSNSLTLIKPCLSSRYAGRMVSEAVILVGSFRGRSARRRQRERLWSRHRGCGETTHGRVCRPLHA